NGLLSDQVCEQPDHVLPFFLLLADNAVLPFPPFPEHLPLAHSHVLNPLLGVSLLFSTARLASHKIQFLNLASLLPAVLLSVTFRVIVLSYYVARLFSDRAHRISCSCFSLHGMLYFVYHVLLLLSRNVARFLPSVSHKIGFPLQELKQLAPIENAPL